MEDPTSGTTHDLLLALAGRVDDDLLRWARELVALGEDARAVEMLTASLVAARAVMPPQVRSALVAAARSARTDLGPAAALPPPHPETGTEHLFAAPGGGDPVAVAVLEFPARPLTGCSVLLARRLTPAGTAPGPLPHPVVLVRVHDHTRRADVLAYQLGAALERAGAPASVEVLPADGPVQGYHAAALAAAVELRTEVTDDRPWRPPPPPVPPVERHALAPPVGRPPRRLAPDPHPLAPEPPAPASRYRPEPVVTDGPESRDDDHAAAEDSAAATARLQPASEREPEGIESATARLVSEPGRRFDDHEHDDEHDQDDEDDAQDDEDDLEDGRFADDHDADEDDQDEVADEDPAARAEEAFPEPPSPHPLAAPRPLPLRDDSRPGRATPLPSPPSPPPPTPLPSRDNRPRPTVTPISRAMPNPIPLRRSGGPNPIPRPLPAAESRPSLRRVDDDRDRFEPSVDERAEPPQEEQPTARRDTPAFESLSDPLNGPLHQPLLAPLLDPTRPEDDPLGSADRRRDEQRPAARRTDDQRADDRRAEPAAPQNDDEWSKDWLSGTWAMAPSALEEPAAPRPEPEPEPEPVEDAEPGRPAPRPVPRSPARHRFPDEPPSNGSRAYHERSEDGDDEPSEGDDDDREELGLRPESIARLSDADRQLLARLQAELLEGRRQRIGRRIINGAPTNGSRRGHPPDYTN
ncbi:hypothetical protein K1T35_46270 [Pseudonocardia sp. DSM 110487]|uniref:hypothetical protein n=1 Tax=Pseudonocardia sp. DSM 110487 TaxID=2865833 RepID=UPI001C6A11D3|nr:hypothetical protein [Pseudonocardia sp. DSM 110487]QYN35617.1 hypothetical protein K1T35_46270 [Pseudonocardia sp. DSM 110487]